MSSIATTVFKVIIGLLENKGRDIIKAAEKLKDGHKTDPLLDLEIDNLLPYLDRLSKEKLLASISFFEEGIDLLYDVFNKTRSSSEHNTSTTQAAKLELTYVDESATRALSNAKTRFKVARWKAIEAFANEALSMAIRILAMQFRVMATILERIDNPEDAIAPCMAWIADLNSMALVKDAFKVELNKGWRSRFGKDERRKIIVEVCRTNMVVQDVFSSLGFIIKLPPILVEDKDVDPLRDERVLEVLRKLDIEFQSE